MFKRVFSLFLATLIFASTLSIFAYADSNGDYISNNSFWNWLAGTSDLAQVVVDIVPFTGTCSVSEDTRHHAKSYQKDKENGRYKCICTYCGKEFTAYESDLKQSYTDQVKDMPATGYNSAGKLIWQPTRKDVLVSSDFEVLGKSLLPLFNSESGYYEKGQFSAHFNSDGKSITICFSESLLTSYPMDCKMYFVAPITGVYVLLSMSCGSFHGVTSSGVIHEKEFFYKSSTSHLMVGSSFCVNSDKVIDSGCYEAANSYLYFSSNHIFPVYEVVPDTAIDTSPSSVYAPTTRPTAITGGNYGIVGDNGQITKVEDNSTIINETNNTYYNPATGQTVPITDWSYNYEDRSYTVTTDSGNTSTITYGDENISIVENNVVEGGDTVTNNYTIYYVTNNVGGGGDDPDDPNSGSSSGSTTEPDKPSKPDPSTCKHEYTLSKSAAPDCKNAGYKIYKCDLCGNDYTETLAALGHDWQVVTETPDVPDTPDSSDSGSTPDSSSAPTYTLYRCSRCGIEYKDTDGSGAPSDKEDGGILGWFKKLFGSIFNGILDVLSSIVGGAIDLICKLIDDLVEGITHVIDSLFDTFSKIADFGGGFKDFLAAFFNFVPPEIITLLAFSISLAIILMVLKFFRG